MVHNPAEPMLERDILTLEEDLAVSGGLEGQPEASFLDISGLDVDGQERIFVLDPKAADIKIFDNNGGFIKTIGGKGEGPGEFVRPETIACSPGGELYVYDGGRRLIHVFNEGGSPVREIPIGYGFFFGPKFLSDGGMVAGHVEMGEEARTKLFLMDEESEPVQELVDLYATKLPQMPLFLYRFGINLIWQIMPGGHLVYGDLLDSEYRLSVIDRKGRLIRRISKVYKKVSLSSEESESLIIEWFGRELQSSMFQFVTPGNYPPFQMFLTDERGRIYVKRFEALAYKHRHLIEVFSAEGKYLGDVTIPAAVVPAVIREDKVYAIFEDEEGFKSVKRFRIIWNMKDEMN